MWDLLKWAIAIFSVLIAVVFGFMLVQAIHDYFERKLSDRRKPTFHPNMIVVCDSCGKFVPYGTVLEGVAIEGTIAAIAWTRASKRVKRGMPRTSPMPQLA